MELIDQSIVSIRCYLVLKRFLIYRKIVNRMNWIIRFFIGSFKSCVKINLLSNRLILSIRRKGFVFRKRKRLKMWNSLLGRIIIRMELLVKYWGRGWKKSRKLWSKEVMLMELVVIQISVFDFLVLTCQKYMKRRFKMMRVIIEWILLKNNL